MAEQFTHNPDERISTGQIETIVNGPRDWAKEMYEADQQDQLDKAVGAPDMFDLMLAEKRAGDTDHYGSAAYENPADAFKDHLAEPEEKLLPEGDEEKLLAANNATYEELALPNEAYEDDDEGIDDQVDTVIYPAPVSAVVEKPVSHLPYEQAGPATLNTAPTVIQASYDAHDQSAPYSEHIDGYLPPKPSEDLAIGLGEFTNIKTMPVTFSGDISHDLLPTDADEAPAELDGEQGVKAHTSAIDVVDTFTAKEKDDPTKWGRQPLPASELHVEDDQNSIQAVKAAQFAPISTAASEIVTPAGINELVRNRANAEAHAPANDVEPDLSEAGEGSVELSASQAKNLENFKKSATALLEMRQSRLDKGKDGQDDKLTSQLEKLYKQYEKRGLDAAVLDTVIDMVEQNVILQDNLANYGSKVREIVGTSKLDWLSQEKLQQLDNAYFGAQEEQGLSQEALERQTKIASKTHLKDVFRPSYWAERWDHLGDFYYKAGANVSTAVAKRRERNEERLNTMSESDRKMRRVAMVAGVVAGAAVVVWSRTSGGHDFLDHTTGLGDLIPQSGGGHGLEHAGSHVETGLGGGNAGTGGAEHIPTTPDTGTHIETVPHVQAPGETNSLETLAGSHDIGITQNEGGYQSIGQINEAFNTHIPDSAWNEIAAKLSPNTVYHMGSGSFGYNHVGNLSTADKQVFLQYAKDNGYM